MKRKYLAFLGVFVPLSFIGVSAALAEELRIESKYGDLSGETSELVEYSDPENLYSFSKPSTWEVHRIPGMSYARLENLDVRLLKSLPKGIQRQYFKIEIVILPAEGLPLAEWVTRQNATSYPLPKILEQQNIEVNERSAIYQIEQFDSFVHPVVFIKENDSVYVLNIFSADDVFEPFVRKFLENFKFN